MHVGVFEVDVELDMIDEEEEDEVDVEDEEEDGVDVVEDVVDMEEDVVVVELLTNALKINVEASVGLQEQAEL